MFLDKISDRLKSLDEKSRLRKIPSLENSGIPKHKVDFRSNDYLRLSRHKKVVEAYCLAASKKGSGSGAARLLGGDSIYHRNLESKLAQIHRSEACLLFNTGYMANLALMRCLGELSQNIFMDRLAHASLIDGAYYHLKKLSRYSHNDLEDLERLLKQSSNTKNALVVTETLHSMNGDFVDLEKLFQLQKIYGFMLILDEAHSFGGYPEISKLISKYQNENLVVVGTLGKALGSNGAFVCANQKIISYLINHARPFIYSTALPPGSAAAALESIAIIEESPSLIKGFSDLRNQAISLFLKRKIILKEVTSHIVPVILGKDSRATEASDFLSAKGFLCLAVRPPTVPENSSRLRVSLHSKMTMQELEDFSECIGDFMEGHP